MLQVFIGGRNSCLFTELHLKSQFYDLQKENTSVHDDDDDNDDNDDDDDNYDDNDDDDQTYDT